MFWSPQDLIIAMRCARDLVSPSFLNCKKLNNKLLMDIKKIWAHLPHLGFTALASGALQDWFYLLGREHSRICILYLLDLLTKYQSGRTLISATLNLLKIPRSKLNQREDCAFAVAAQNSGIACLIISVYEFKSQPKTYLLFMSFNHWLAVLCVLLWCDVCYFTNVVKHIGQHVLF